MTDLPTRDNVKHLLGEVVSYDVESRFLSHQEIKDALDAAGLDPSEAHELNPKTAFTRATKDLKKDRLIEKVVEDKSGLITFQLTKKSLNDLGGRVTINHDYECLVELDTTSGRIRCEEDTALEVSCQMMYQKALEARTSSDINRLVQRLFKKNADLYPINRKKGVAYFVPEAHREFTAKVDMFLSMVGGYISRFPVPKGDEVGDASVREAVNSGLSEYITEMNQFIEEWDSSTRGDTMSRAIDKWQEIKHKAESYAEYLGYRQDELLAELDKTRKELLSKIEDVEEAKAEKKASKTAVPF